MQKKPLKETNPYLKDPELYEALIELSASSSIAVEGILTKYPKLSKSLEKKLKAIISINEPSA